ncbi:PAS domain-containing sensor histidine kinase [Methanocella sp. MCL-LM]|uniref:PAS domain-containing sensor histidine kinase n=1 Tax=Methanocella sp. MCL-LM TaxID=3412035 RepID=UPI003C75CDA4
MPEFSEKCQICGVDTYHLVVDLAEEGIWILDRNDQFVFANKKLRSMLGYSGEELLCCSVYNIVAEQDREIVKKALERRHLGVKETYRARLKRKDSGLIWVAVAASPILDREGNYTGTVTVALDVSQEKENEEALKKEKAQSDMYLDLMAHDINNLNQVAIGFLEVAISELPEQMPDKDQILGRLNKSLGSLYRCTDLINNVKTLRRLKTEQRRLEDVDLGEIIAEAIRDYPQDPGKRTSVNYARPQGCIVRANPLLKEVFTNLIGNSVKHSRGPVTVWISVDSAWEHGRKYYEAAVADDGPGIPDDQKKELFQRFKSEYQKTSGHGMGLYLVRTIVEDFGGMVRVQDRVSGDYSHGVKFVVLLPAVEWPPG